jgi:hypothetical protein
VEPVHGCVGCDYGHQGKDVARDVQNVLMDCDGVTSEGSNQKHILQFWTLKPKKIIESLGKQPAHGFSDIHVPFFDHFLICCFPEVLIFLWIPFYFAVCARE